VANPDTVKEVNKRLEKISVDGIIDSGYISEMITDKRLTFFPLVQETERPDKVAASRVNAFLYDSGYCLRTNPGTFSCYPGGFLAKC
jgi:hypothetical protein